MIKTKTIIDVYSDGSGNTLDSDGGWGCVLVVDGVKVREKCGFLPSATNNTAELTAAINGLGSARAYIYTSGLHEDNCIITLISDSQLVLNYAKNTWKCKKDHLKSLCGSLQDQYNHLKANTKWVRGHSGDTYNERCDELAGTARKAGRKRAAARNFIMTILRLGLIEDQLDVIAIIEDIKKLTPVPY